MEDTIKLPLDADGVPIRPGDVVYNLKIEDTEPQKVWMLRYTGIQICPWNIEVLGETLPYVPNCFTHTKPDTLEDIEAIIRELIQSNEKWALSEVPNLMERIKRMVER